jgi:hypothetical protein
VRSLGQSQTWSITAAYESMHASEEGVYARLSDIIFRGHELTYVNPASACAQDVSDLPNAANDTKQSAKGECADQSANARVINTRD